ncbi:MAG: hypothetical protein IPG68_16150 [Micrococcales bacterium]|nr:hypothetical protein [Micrococcales bacterium]
MTASRDPFMMLTTPTEQFLSDYPFTTPASGFRANFVNVVAPNDAVGDVKLDGSAVPAGAFTPIGSTGFSGAQLDLTLGSHTIVGQPLRIYVYGFDQADSYGYPGGAAYAAINDAAGLTLTPATQSKTINTQACVTTTVTDKNGKGLPGIQVNLKATGVNPLDTTVLTDSAGSNQYCYNSTPTGTDTFTASSNPLTASATVAWTSGAPHPPVVKKKLPINAKAWPRRPPG